VALNGFSMSCVLSTAADASLNDIFVWSHLHYNIKLGRRKYYLGTCEASWFDSISNRTSDSRFDSYWWSDSKFSNRPHCQ